jgi:Dna[CI] antecedent, DciA
MAARLLNTFISSNPFLKTLLERSARLNEMQRIFLEAAPKPLVGFSRVAALEEGCLVIVADSGTVAAKLRQLTPRLLKKFSATFPEVTAIRVQVQVRTEASPTSAQLEPKGSLGKIGLESLRELEQGLEASPLRSAISRMLARHAR